MFSDEIREVEIAWAAGLFEGEGSLGTAGRCIKASVTSSDLDVLRKFKNVVGFGRIGSPKKRNPNALIQGNKDVYEWQATTAEAMLYAFLPYLGERRTARVRELIAWREQYLKVQTKPRKCKGCHTVFWPRYRKNGVRQIYCSTACFSSQKAKHSHRARMDVKRSIPRYCVVCDKILPADSRMGRKYCSALCKSRGVQLVQTA